MLELRNLECQGAQVARLRGGKGSFEAEWFTVNSLFPRKHRSFNKTSAAKVWCYSGADDNVIDDNSRYFTSCLTF